MSFAIVVDSAADIHSSLQGEDGFWVVYNHVVIEGKEYVEGRDISRKEILDLLEGGGYASTSQAPPAAFKEAYDAALESYEEVLSIHVSSRMSGVLNNANMVARQYGDRIKLFDSGSVSVGITFFIRLAVLMRERGKTIEETLDALQRAKDDITVLVLLGNLDYVRRGGRVSAGEAFFAKLLGIKAILAIEEGIIFPKYKAWGIRGALRKMLAIAKRRYGERSHPFIMTGEVNAREYYIPFKKEMEEYFEPSTLLETGLSPVILTHTGPFIIGLAIAPALESYL